jgi:hypothetical protein
MDVDSTPDDFPFPCLYWSDAVSGLEQKRTMMFVDDMTINEQYLHYKIRRPVTIPA